MKIDIRRDALLKELRSTAEQSSVLITGSPGIGKSWLLSEYLVSLKREGRFVLGFAAEEHPVSSLQDLYKSIGLKTAIPALLRDRKGSPVLVIDGLDALRSEPGQIVLRDLILEVFAEAPRARVICTIRSFDLRESPTFSKLRSFSNQGSSFAEVRVDRLSDSELTQVFQEAKGFEAFWAGASEATKELLRNPFNLQIAIALLHESVDHVRLQSVQSQVELLDRYWNRRIESAPNGRAMREVLRLVVETMISTRLLSIPDLALRIENEQPLRELLSLELLQKSAGGRLSFSHNIFFDYAMARVYIDEIMLLPFLSADTSRVLYYRSALHYFFGHLWAEGREMFWTVTEVVCGSIHVNATAKLLPAVVIAESALEFGDFAPLLASSKAGLASLLRDVLNAVLVLGTGVRRLLWLQLLAAMSSKPSLSQINEVMSLLFLMASEAIESEKAIIAVLSRKFTRWSWSPTDALTGEKLEELGSVVTGRLLSTSLLDIRECRVEVREFVTELLGRIGVSGATSEILRLVHEMSPIAEEDPELAALIFDRLYEYSEASEEPTLLGTGSVLRLTSTRKQDYSTARYAAAASFSILLKKHPLSAARVATRAVNAEVEEAHPFKEKKNLQTFRFDIRGKLFTYQADYSEIWGDGSGLHYTSLGLLDLTLKESLERDSTLRSAILETVLTNASVAMAWRQVLEFAIEHPRALFDCVAPILESSQLIAAPEVSIDVGRLLHAASAAGALTRETFRSIEAAILALQEDEVLLRYESIDGLKKRLLRSVDRSFLSSLEALSIWDSAKNARDNTPFHQISGSALSERQAMQLRGIDPDAPSNRTLLTALEPVEEFNTKVRNHEVEASVAASMLEPLISLRDVVAGAQTPDVPDELLVRAKGSLIEAAGNVFRSKQLPTLGALGAVCRSIAISGALDQDPKFDPNYHLPFDHPSWSGPSPRIEAAQAIGTLIWNYQFDPETREIFERLSKDEVPAVRFQIARTLPGIFNRVEYREDFWALLSNMIERESTAGVLVGLLSSLRLVAARAPEQTVELLSRIIDRGIIAASSSDAMRLMIDMLSGLYIVRNLEIAHSELQRFQSDVERFQIELEQTVLAAFQFVSPPQNPDNLSRARAISLLEEIFTVTHSFAALQSQTHDQERLAAPTKIMNTFCARLYFVFDSMGLRTNEQAALTRVQKVEMYQELGTLIAKTTQREDDKPSIPLTALSAYYLLQLCNVVLSFDPENVIVFTAAICRHGDRAGLLNDYMARTEAVKLVESALADFKENLRNIKVSTAIGVLLDLFIRAGWSEAINLSFRLDEAFR